MAGTAAVVGKESGLSAEGAFQLYPVLREYMISPVPPSISDESAAVLGMAFSTAAFGLFSPDYLGLDPPRVPPPANPPPGAAHPRAVIVTGGASSLGACAVQLAASAGYEVVSTCSPRNFALVRRLGAAHVFDYARPAPELVADMVAALRGRALAGALTVGAGADQVCAAVFKERAAAAPQLPTRKFVALAGGSRRDPATLDGAMVVPGLIYNMMGLMAKSAVRKILTGIEIKFVMIKDVVNPDSCVSRVYQDFLGPALAAGQFVPAPDALVVGRGLEQIQEGLEVQKKGVSAQKVVVSLP